MIRKSNTIPQFVRHLGSRLFSYILNIDIEEAEILLTREFNITEIQNEIINDLVSTCRSWKDTDQNDPNFSFHLDIQQARQDDGVHMFNYYRSKSGGKLPVVKNKDQLIKSIQILGIQAYPAFLIDYDRNGPFFIHASLYDRRKHTKQIGEMVLADEDLKQLFDVLGDSEMNTYCTFNNSVGRR